MRSKRSRPHKLFGSLRAYAPHSPSRVTLVTFCYVHAVILSLPKSITPYVVAVWGDRCGREVPQFNSHPVSISDPRSRITRLGLFFVRSQQVAGNGPTYLVSSRSHICSIGLVGGYQDDFFMPIKGPRDANP
ncbi:hypothetical protein AMTR_s00093p00169580 [Amborella trichopoda]|uniref:Uncharacterized protein n=1 Tax=Amborella trichopoda TaxID=13333 RepID=W1NVY1_AMBTC|nr:hypothetical protein AMTR_s00093p00169580 [Amborella trichopoda]